MIPAPDDAGREGKISSSAKCSMGLLLVILVFYAATIRTGHHWGDDYALYIHHAKNIATGVPYADIGYIADPDYPLYSVRMAPPVFPLALAGIYKIFGMNFTAFKVVGILFLVGSLAILLALFRDYLPLPYRLLLVAIIGFNPFFWNAKDDVLSDIPFCFFVLLTAWLMEKHRSPWLCGIATYLAIGTRTIGLVLLPAFILYDVIRHKRITRYSGIAVGTSAALAFLQRLVLHGDTLSSYINVFHPALHAYILNFRNYPLAFGRFWPASGFWMTALIYCAMVLLAIKGARGRQPGFLALFVALYAITLLLWAPGQDARYLIPIFVFFLFYAIRGMERLGHAVTFSVCALLLVGYALHYRTENFRIINEGNGRETFMAMCTWVKNNTAAEDRIVFNRARTLSLFTDRAASPYHQPQDADALWKYFRSQNIRYIVVAGQVFEKDRLVLAPVIEVHKTELEMKYENPDFAVYRVRPEAPTP